MTATGKPSLIMQALFDRALLLETTGPSLPVNLPEDSSFTPPADGQWLRVEFFPNEPRWGGLANGCMDQGILRVLVVWRKNRGLIQPGNVAGQVMSHFEKNTIMTNGSVRVKVSDDPWLGPELPEENAVSLPVTVPWTA